jgi:deoxycytidylate deaminase
VRTGDANTGLQRIFDADKVQREVNAQVAITAAFSKEAPKAVATFSANQMADLKKDLAKAKIYVDLFPCNECAKEIIQAGIKTVIYLEDKYADTDAIKASKIMFDQCDVMYKQLIKENQTHPVLTLTLNIKK